MSSFPPVKIAVVGAGLIGPRHANTVHSSPSATLSAIVDPAPSAAQLAQSLNVPHYKSTAELISSSDRPSAAIICTPNHTHVPIGLELIRSGIHILVEKPISTDVESGALLVRTAAEHGVKILVGHHRRFNSFVQATKAALDSGKIGDPIAINGLWTTCKPPSYFDDPTSWRRESTGGVVLINLIHEVDLLHCFFGPIVKVYAEATKSTRGFEAEEGCAITFRFESGVVGSFLCCDASPSPHNFEAGTGENPLIPQVGKDFYRILGTEGTLSVPDMRISRYAEGEKGWHQELREEVLNVSAKVPFEAQLEHLVRVVRGEERATCSGEEGLAALVVCEAVRESLKTGMPVVIKSAVE